MVQMQHARSKLSQVFLGNIQETTEAPYAPTDAPLAFSGLVAPCKTRCKHAHACRTISAPCCQLSNPSISTKPPIPTASSLETWWKRNNLAGMERDLPGMPTDQPFSHQPALCCSPTLLHVGNGRLSESRPRLKWRETSGSFLGLWNWPLPTVFLFLWTGLAGRQPFCKKKRVSPGESHSAPKGFLAVFSRIIVLLRLPQKLCPATLHHV